MLKILRDKCANCGCCSEVTKNFLGDPIPTEDYYYQCIADTVDECYDDNSMYDEIVIEEVAELPDKYTDEELAEWLDKMEAQGHTDSFPAIECIDEIEI